MLLWITLLSACGGEATPPEGEDKAEQEPDPRTLVEVAAVAPGSVASTLGASAAVESDAQAVLVPETTGVVTGIHAEEGDAVRAGQLLAVIANPSLDAAYQRASAELERATTDAEAAERLFDQGAVSKTELDTARNALRVARTAHEEASKTRGFTRLESPIDGVVATRAIRYGETVGAQPAFTVVDLSRLRVVVSLPERDLARVKVGQPAKLVSAYDEKVASAGTVERIAPVVDAATGTVRVTVRLAPDSAMRPGQFVRVAIEVDRHEGVLTVPRRALVWEEGKAFVFRIGEWTAEDEEKPEDGEEKEEGGGGFAFKLPWDTEEEEKPEEIPGPKRKAVRVPVEVGYEDGELAEIVSGLAAGEQVVTVGNAALRDGARVRLPGDPTVAAAPDDEEKKEAGG
ncbi:MAG: efflux RND transporter periplasmic adaptor subunit [Myxococcota bacterium]